MSRQILLGLLLITGLNVSATEIDPPDRVARLSYIQGEVSTLLADESENKSTWTDATLNRPLTSGDTLWIKDNSRAELQMGSATLRLDQNTDLAITELGDNSLVLRLTNGALNLFVKRMRNDETISIDTPNGAVNISRPGEYHVAVLDRGTRTHIKIYSGEAQLSNNRTTPLHARQSAEMMAAGRGLTTQDGIDPRDALDEWSAERNRREQRSASSRYVDEDVIGYTELDHYGSWASEPDYGNVWYPNNVVVGWAPYRYGRWVSIAPWGWTWVDDAPWGFAPFHYGRWAHVRGHWGWVPGPRHIRAVYAPALVAWMGGPSVNVSVTLGAGVGWFPLAPREVFIPGYRCSPRHLHSVNISNTFIVNNTFIDRAYERRAIHVDYANRSIRDAVTVMHRDQFVNAQPTRDHLIRVNDRELRQWQPQATGPNVNRSGENFRDRSSRVETHVDTHVDTQRDSGWRGAQDPRVNSNTGSTHRDQLQLGNPRDRMPPPDDRQQNNVATRESNITPQQNTQQERRQVIAPEPQNNSWRDSPRDVGRERSATETPPTQRFEAPARDQNRERHFENRGSENRGFDQRSNNNRGQVFAPPQPAPSQPAPTPPQSNGDREHHDRTENRNEDRAQGNRERGRGDRM